MKVSSAHTAHECEYRVVFVLMLQRKVINGRLREVSSIDDQIGPFEASLKPTVLFAEFFVHYLKRIATHPFQSSLLGEGRLRCIGSLLSLRREVRE